MRGFHCSFAGRVWAISLSADGFQGILVESHYHKENINLSYPQLFWWHLGPSYSFVKGDMADRPRIELRLPVKVGRISNPLGYHYPTGPKQTGIYNLKSLPSPRRPIFIYIPLLVISNVRRRRRAGLMAIRAVSGGSGRIRTHGSVTSQMISSQRRYAHFGTLPLFIRKSFYSFM